MKARLWIFVLSAAASLLLADYSAQASAGRGTTARAYLQTVVERLAGRLSERDALERELTAFLPEPHGTWQRVRWSEAASREIVETSLARKFKDITPKANVLNSRGLHATVWNRRMARGKEHNAVIYYRDDEVIELRVTRPKPQNRIEAVVAQGMEMHVHAKKPFANIRGVAYTERYESVQMRPVGSGITLFRAFSARIGNEIQIEVDTNAKPQSIKTFMSKIDTNGMVAYLRAKLPHLQNRKLNKLPQVGVSARNDGRSLGIKRVHVRQ